MTHPAAKPCQTCGHPSGDHRTGSRTYGLHERTHGRCFARGCTCTDYIAPAAPVTPITAYEKPAPARRCETCGDQIGDHGCFVCHDQAA